MAMTVGSGSSGDPDVMVDINTIPIQTHAVKLNMPVGNPPPPSTPPEVVTLDIDFDGTLAWNGEQVNNTELDARFRGAASQPVQPEFHIRPNKLVTYKYVAHVMAAAQRDGVTKIGLIGAEQFLD